MTEVSIVEVANGPEGVVLDQTAICLVDRKTDRLYDRAPAAAKAVPRRTEAAV